MAQKISSELSRATLAGLEHLLAQKDATQGTVAGLVGVRQQTISSASKNGVGLKLAAGVAKALNTTIDGMVRRFGGEGRGLVRAGDVIGWKKAVSAARERWPDGPTPRNYAMAAEILLPVAPDEASDLFARDLARVLTDHCSISAVREKASDND